MSPYDEPPTRLDQFLLLAGLLFVCLFWYVVAKWIF